MHSKLIARLMGPVLLVMGLGMALGLWLSPDIFNGVMRDFMGNLAIIWLVGILMLVAGIAIINTHNLWIGDWRVIITLLGWLAIIAVLMSAVSMFYYLRLVVAMYLKEGRDADVAITPSLGFVGAVCLVITLVLGVYPPPLIHQVSESSRAVAARASIPHASR